MPPPTSTQRVATPAAPVFAAGCMIAQQVGGKATRDALFLSNFPASDLPKAMFAAAVLAVLGVLVMSRALSRFGPARLVPMLFAGNGALFGLEWFLVGKQPAAAAAIVYLHVAVIGFTLISGFWSVINERFDPHTAKQVVGRIATGAIVGGLLGGLIAERVATYLEARAMLLVLVALNLLCALGVWRTGGPTPSSRRAGSSEPRQQASPLTHLRTSRYLQLIGVLVGLTAMAAGLVDYVFKAHAAAAYTTGESLMSFFAIFYTLTSFVAVLLQSSLGNRALSRLGIGGTIAVLPSAVVVAGIIGASFMRLWTMVALRGVQAMLESSLFRPAYELLYTPVAPETKRPTKTLLDVGFDRLGGASAGALMMGLLALEPGAANTAAVLTTVGLGLVSLWVALRLHRGYVQELAASLRSGAVEIADNDIVDATTRRTLSETTMAIDRENLLAEIQKLRQERESDRGTPPPRQVGEGADQEPQRANGAEPPELVAPIRAGRGDVDLLEAPNQASADDLVLQRIAAVRSGDTDRIRQAVRGIVGAELAAHVIPLLGEDRVARIARRALRANSERLTGQLTDALLDPRQPLRVRQRVASLLASCPDRRTVPGLLAALAEEDREIRRRAAESLATIVGAHPDLAPRRRVIFAAAEREIAREGAEGIDHVFAILGVALDAEVMQLSLRALRSDDPGLRGTSLEYLENVLPESVADAIWPALEQICETPALLGGPPSARQPAPKRSQKEIAAELRRSVADLVVDRQALLRSPSE